MSLYNVRASNLSGFFIYKPTGKLA